MNILKEEIPKNGLMIFASEEEIIVEIPEQQISWFYFCGNEFWRPKPEEIEEWGIVLIDTGNALITSLRNLKDIDTVEGYIQGKHRQGGQSAARFQRLREEAKRYFYRNVAESVNSRFVNSSELKGVIIGGPGIAKNEFLRTGFLDYRLKNKISPLFDVGYVDEQGIRELLDKSSELVKNHYVIREKKIVDDYLLLLGKNGNISYGKNKIIEEIGKNRVERLLISNDFDLDFYVPKNITVDFIKSDQKEIINGLGGIVAFMRY